MDVHTEIFLDSQGRRVSQKIRILEVLREAGLRGMTNAELKDVAIRFSSLTNSLQLDGYDIRLTNEGGGIVRYTLHNSEPIRDKVVPKDANEKVKDFFVANGEQVSYDMFKEFIEDNGLHVKHRPGGIKK